MALSFGLSIIIEGGEIKLVEDSIPPLFKTDVEHKVRTGNDIIFKPNGLCNCSMYILTVDLLRRFLYIVFFRIFYQELALPVLHM